MTVELTLKPRRMVKVRVDKEGVVERPMWHDSVAIMYALDALAENKSPTKAGLWMIIAGAIETERLYAEDYDKDLPAITIELANKRAGVLWKHLIRLPVEKFGRDNEGKPTRPPLGLLYLMLEDIADQLGYDVADYIKETMAGDDEDDDDD